MLEVYDLDMRKTAVLENAFDIEETEELNAVYTLIFSLPSTDPKVANCKKFHYVRYDGGELYRILRPTGSEGDIGISTFECEHAIAKLVDDVMFRSHVYGGLGLYTRDSINYVLARQEARRWTLDECDFSRQFEYAWESENLLNALYSIPNRMVDPYMWAYNTSAMPWRVSLKAINVNDAPQFYLRATKNVLVVEEDDPADQICTRLYCLGYGEGVNQLGIEEVNNGLPYLQSPQRYITEYGLIKKVWIDRRFEDAESLKERGVAILAELQEPRMTRTFTAADLGKLTNDDIDKARVGCIVMLADDGTKTFVTRVVRSLDKDGVMELTISSRPADVTDAISDLADRQRIEQVYAQGATQLYAQSIQANATAQIGARLNFYVPEEMRIINAVKCKITLDQFRSYSRATTYAGESVQTSTDSGGSQTSSSEGGGSERTSGSGGGSRETTLGGGGATVTSGSSSRSTSSNKTNYIDGTTGTSGTKQEKTGSTNSHWHYFTAVQNHSHNYKFNFTHNHDMSHTHGVTISSHQHAVDIPSHRHSVSIPSHTHSVNIPSHSHNVTIPAHAHGIEQGIFEFGAPSGADIYINGIRRGAMSIDAELDITAWMLDAQRKIPRNQWHSIEIRPNDLAYVTVDMFVQGFVQSKGGSTH